MNFIERFLEAIRIMFFTKTFPLFIRIVFLFFFVLMFATIYRLLAYPYAKSLNDTKIDIGIVKSVEVPGGRGASKCEFDLVMPNDEIKHFIDYHCGNYILYVSGKTCKIWSKKDIAYQIVSKNGEYLKEFKNSYMRDITNNIFMALFASISAVWFLITIVKSEKNKNLILKDKKWL